MNDDGDLSPIVSRVAAWVLLACLVGAAGNVVWSAVQAVAG